MGDHSERMVGSIFLIIFSLMTFGQRVSTALI